MPGAEAGVPSHPGGEPLALPFHPPLSSVPLCFRSPLGPSGHRASRISQAPRSSQSGGSGTGPGAAVSASRRVHSSFLLRCSRTGPWLGSVSASDAMGGALFFSWEVTSAQHASLPTPAGTFSPPALHVDACGPGVGGTSPLQQCTEASRPGLVQKAWDMAPVVPTGNTDLMERETEGAVSPG